MPLFSCLRLSPSAVAVLLLLPLACEGEVTEPAPFVARDSAGVRIVESRSPKWESEEGWSIDPSPRLTIGAVEGDLPYLFGGILGAVRLSDGHIVIADRQSRQLRIFDSGGVHVNTIGRKGSGPGEFEALRSIHVLGTDSIAAWDALFHRLTVFTFDGKIGREWTVEGIDRLFPSLDGVAGDGGLLIWVPDPSAPSESTEAEYRPALHWVRFLVGGGPPLHLRDGRGPETFRASGEGWATNRSILFGKVELVAAGEDAWYIMDSGDPAVQVLDWEGRLLAIYRIQAKARTVTAPMVASARQQVREANARMADRNVLTTNGIDVLAEASKELPPHRDRLPYFDRLLVAEDGNLWLRQYQAPGDSIPMWSVIGNSGRWLGDVQVPIGLDVYQISPDFLLGRSTDELGVESVRLFAISTLQPEH